VAARESSTWSSSGAGQVVASIPGLICKQATVLLYGHGHAGADLSVLNNLMFKEPVLVTSVGASGSLNRTVDRQCIPRRCVCLSASRLMFALLQLTSMLHLRREESLTDRYLRVRLRKRGRRAVGIRR